MLISPSIASADILHVANELEFIDKYFNNIHIDIEDGVAVRGITFGMKMANRICSYSTSVEKSLHLEVYEPLNYIDELLKLPVDIIHIQVCHLSNPIQVIKEFKKRGLPTGINIRIEDIDKPYYNELLELCDDVLITTTSHLSGKEEYLSEMERLAIELSKTKKVYVDGRIDYQTYQRLQDSKIYCAVMGRAIFEDKNLAIKQYCS